MDTKPTFAQSIDNVWNIWEGNKEDAWQCLISRRPLSAIFGQTCQSIDTFWSLSVENSADKDLGSSVQLKILRTWQFPWKQQSRSYQSCKWSPSDFNQVAELLLASSETTFFLFTVLLPLIKTWYLSLRNASITLPWDYLYVLLRLTLIDWDWLFKNTFKSYDYLQQALQPCWDVHYGKV